MTRRKKAFIFHGFNVADGGARTTDQLIPYAEALGYDPTDGDYGNFNLIDVREHTDDVVEALVKQVLPGDIFIAHSHGCAICAMAMEKGAPFQAGLMIHPALRSNWRIPKGHPIREIAVFYHWSDYATWFAFGLRTISHAWQKAFGWSRHYWGAMGSIGPLSKDRFKKYTGAWWHSDGFNDIAHWGPKWQAALQKAIFEDDAGPAPKHK